MTTMRTWLLGTCWILCASVAHASQFDPSYQTAFDSSDLSRWTGWAGHWLVFDGRLVHGEVDPAAILTVEHYDPDTIEWPTLHADYALDVYAKIMNSGAAASVGVVYDFTDLANYHEVIFSPNGTATLRRVMNGVVSVVGTGTFAAPGTNKWFHISLFRAGQITRVKVDGVQVLLARQEGLAVGDAGLVAYDTGAQFDDFYVRDFTLVDPYVEDFNDRVANRWTRSAGGWAITDFRYVNTTLNATSMSVSPVTQMWDSGRSPFSLPFTFKARMMNPYGGSGNLIGVVWVEDSQNYVEVLFSPDGQARINAVDNGVRTTLAEAPYQGGGPNQWFEVEVAGNGDFSGVGGHVKVNGITVFDPLPRSELRGANIGFVTHWVLGARFDAVRISPLFFRPLSATMNDGRLPRLFYSPVSTWRVEDGTLNGFGIEANHTAGLDVFHDIADTEFRARIVNHYGAAGNLVGLAYAYRGPGDYFEVVFSPTGVARLNRVLKGVITNVATASYAGGGPHRWFDVQLIQRNLRTTVRVNGVTVFNRVPQPDAGGADFGLVTHWADANFDDISIAEVAPAP